MRTTVKTAKEVSISRNISKAKINKGGGLDVTYYETIIFTDGDGQEVELSRQQTSEGRNLIHDDMQAAFDMLRTHLAIICDQPEAKDKTFYELDEDVERLNNFKVSSYSIGGSGNHEGVSISGNRRLRGGRVLNLNAPFTKYFDENDPYESATELQSLINHCNEEVLEYLDGKIKPNAQGDLFDQAESEAEDME
ncbi:hypothetical protein [Parapedobacter indicus]|uniref:Uncharacterized protein n=1 Tax=Parapedobacter indicus TaxID=1477437 RepID=A0A1I3UYW0_9SPHI|nr:hypothetical protein [Parapedobacter indicus]PPK99030.1 hypothetical protein CLV26_11561 [Parapedobacter indicus]SFJ88175.1 hypothetical protein SAMN05444682_115117 [Parapedobacter indicus]